MDWNKLRQPSFLLAVLAAVKLIVQPFGVDIPDQDLNSFADGICALVTIIGIFLDHGKPGAPAANVPVPAVPPPEVKADVKVPV